MNLESKLSDLYDAIFLSNIQDYQKMDVYILMALGLKKYLNPDGKIYMSYLYNNTINYCKAKDLANKIGCDVLEVESVYSNSSSNRITDKVLVLNK